VPDESSDFARGSIDLLKIMMLTGAVIGIYSVFQLWFTKNWGLVSFESSGLDFFLKNNSYGGHAYPDTGYFLYMPLAVLISSIIAIPVSVLSFTKHEKKGAAAGIAVGVIIVASVLLYSFYPETEMMLANSKGIIVGDILLRDSLGEGVYSALIGGLFLIIGGMVILINRRINPVTKKEE
jgi:hypothetical protein